MIKSVKRGFFLGLSAAAATKRTIERKVMAFSKQHKISEKDGKTLAKDILNETGKQRKIIEKKVLSEAEKAAKMITNKTFKEIKNLKDKLSKLEKTKKKIVKKKKKK